MSPTNDSLLLSTKEAAAYLTASASTLYRWRRAGEGPEYFRVGGILRYRRSDLDSFLQNNTTKSK